ncbi:carboxynorspermidine decarboxylase [Oligella ureolytica]
MRRQSTTLEVSVLDTAFNGKHLAIVDSSTEAHMLDLLIYRETAPLGNDTGAHRYQICGKLVWPEIFSAKGILMPL